MCLKIRVAVVLRRRGGSWLARLRLSLRPNSSPPLARRSRMQIDPSAAGGDDTELGALGVPVLELDFGQVERKRQVGVLPGIGLLCRVAGPSTLRPRIFRLSQAPTCASPRLRPPWHKWGGPWVHGRSGAVTPPSTSGGLIAGAVGRGRLVGDEAPRLCARGEEEAGEVRPEEHDEGELVEDEEQREQELQRGGEKGGGGLRVLRAP